jgi:hypothetical protein
LEEKNMKKKMYEKIGKNMKNKLIHGKDVPNWRKHEIQSAKSSYYKGKVVKAQKQSKSTGKRPDFFAIGKDRTVGDAKWCTKAKNSHVDQVLRYKQYPFFAQKGIIHYPANAVIPKKVRKYAEEKNVIITKTKTPKIKEYSHGPLGFIFEKQYIR